MKGDVAGLLVIKINSPSNKSRIMMGNNHHFFRTLRKSQNSFNRLAFIKKSSEFLNLELPFVVRTFSRGQISFHPVGFRLLIYPAMERVLSQ